MKPNGCAKENCEYMSGTNGAYCTAPDDSVSINTGEFICPYSEFAVNIKDYQPVEKQETMKTMSHTINQIFSDTEETGASGSVYENFKKSLGI